MLERCYILWLSGKDQGTPTHDVPGSNLLATLVVPLGKVLYPHCLIPRKGLKAIGPLVACLNKQLAFSVAR